MKTRSVFEQKISSCSEIINNKLIKGVHSNIHFVAMQHPKTELQSDFYFLVSLNSNDKNRTETKIKVHNIKEYIFENETIYLIP